MRFAAGTEVPVERSKQEIERILKNYGADQFGYMADEARAAIVFKVRGKGVRMTVLLPKVEDFIRTEKNKIRAPGQRVVERDRAHRQRWRALLLITKAKLEAVETGITTFETEWLPYMILPNGRTVAEQVVPELEGIIESGRMPRLMLGMDEGS